MMSTSFALLAVLACIGVTQVAANCYGEKDGNILIQAENTKMSQGWVVKSQMSGYSGRGYIIWVDENQYVFQGKGLLSYDIESKTGGNYKVSFYSARPGSCNCRHDECNDATVKVGSKMVKLFTSFGSAMNTWKWSLYFDENHKKREPIIYIPKGRSELVIGGRSECYMIDRIALTKTGSQLTESKTTVPCGGSRPSPPKPAPTRKPAPPRPSPPKPKPGGKPFFKPYWPKGPASPKSAYPKCKYQTSWRPRVGVNLIVKNRKSHPIRLAYIRNRKPVPVGQVARGQTRTFRTHRDAYFVVMDMDFKCVRGIRVKQWAGSKMNVQIGGW